MTFYQITAYGTRWDNGWRESFGVPTFYLRDDMQGITTTLQAEIVALHMLQAIAPDVDFTVGVGVSANFDPTTIGA